MIHFQGVEFMGHVYKTPNVLVAVPCDTAIPRYVNSLTHYWEYTDDGSNEDFKEFIPDD